MRLRLRRPQLSDAKALLAFELRNRVFFEAHINARPLGYYTPQGVQEALAAAEEQATRDEGYQFLVQDEAEQLVARINLSRVRRAHFHSADLGYRVAESRCGLGIASEALRLVMIEAFGPLQLQRIEASVHEDNPASLRVLTRSGFVLFGRSRRSFELHGRWLDTLHLECHANS